MRAVLICLTVAVAALTATLFGQASTFAALSPQSTVPAGGVISAVPYVIVAQGNCASLPCRVQFPLVAAKRRVDIQFVSCTIFADNSLDLGFAFLGINDAAPLTSTHHALQWSIRDSGGSPVGEISQPVLLSVSANQRPSIAINYTAASTPVTTCTISGDLVFLQ